MNISIVGLGTWLPDAVRENSAWPPEFGQREHDAGDRTFNDIPPSEDPLSAAIVARDLALEERDPFLGARRRRVATPSFSATDAEVQAARSALERAGTAGHEVDLVLSYSLVPEYIAPGSGVVVAERIGAARALAFSIDSTCASAVVQLEIARAYIEAGMARVVLATQSHLLLRTMPWSHPAAPGLGDAASAMVIARGRGLSVRSTLCVTHGQYAPAVSWVRGRELANDTPWWTPGGAFCLGSRAPEQTKFLMRETVSFGAATLRDAAARADMAVEQIDVLASVQPRGFIPAAIAERLGLPRERAITTYDEIAHVGACGPLFNLERARERGLLAAGQCAAIYAQGAGFTRAAALLEVT
jgi:3-oxoacyl-[acyl-carrier-protein] synthase III